MLWVVKFVDSRKVPLAFMLRVQVRVVGFVIDQILSKSTPHKLKIIVLCFVTDGDIAGNMRCKSVKRWQDRLIVRY